MSHPERSEGSTVRPLGPAREGRSAVSRSLALLGMTLTCGITSAGAQSRWRTEDRVVLGEMLRIYAVASSFERLYVVSGDQVLIRDQVRREWSGPFATPGEGRLQGTLGSVIDPIDRSLWIVTVTGWLRYDPALDLWEQGTTAGPVLLAGIDRTRPIDGLYLRVGGSWFVASRGGGFANPILTSPRLADLVPASTIEDLTRANPQLRSLASGTLLAPGLRAARLTAAALAADQGGWWLGTDGSGLLWLPFGSTLPEQRPWGLPGEVVGAVLAVPGGAWAVTDRTFRGGAALVRVPNELDGTQWYFGDQVFGQPFHTVRGLRAVDSLLWIGTDQGALALSTTGRRVRTLGEQDGLPDRRVLSIAARRGRLVLGTAAGLAEVTDSGVVRVADRYSSPALAVALSGDTTWVGTSIGLFAAVPGEGDLRQVAGWESPHLRTPVPALLWRGDTLVALTYHEVVWRDPRTGSWTVDPDFTSQIGKATALADGAHGIWLAGSRGAGFARLGRPVERRLGVGDALPGEAWDVSVDGDWLWIATSKGLVRFRRRAVEP
jgi:ligand-binding sensor domain-containing protein